MHISSEQSVCSFNQSSACSLLQKLGMIHVGKHSSNSRLIDVDSGAICGAYSKHSVWQVRPISNSLNRLNGIVDAKRVIGKRDSCAVADY